MVTCYLEIISIVVLHPEGSQSSNINPAPINPSRVEPFTLNVNSETYYEFFMVLFFSVFELTPRINSKNEYNMCVLLAGVTVKCVPAGHRSSQ